VLGQVFGSRHGRYAAWAYVQRTWDALRVRVGDMGLSRVVEAVASLPYAERAAIVAFFEAHPPTGAERALARALERIDEREELRRRVTPGLLGRFAS
jgi:puromycin-sensitive aminopeptidase